MSDESLPKYDNPPVVEVVFGASFVGESQFTTAHMGKWWTEIGAEYVHASEVPPLAVVLERTSEQPPQSQPIAPAFPAPRLWLATQDGEHLLQLQRDRILLNWRSLEEEHPYPSFNKVSAEFSSILDRFRGFWRQNLDTEPVYNQYELTYINHIPKGSGWSSIDKIGNLLPDFCWRSDDRFLEPPESIDWRTSFLLKEGAGRLHARVQTARHRQSGTPIVLLDMTARGYMSSREDWFDVAHEAIVRGFSDLTSSSVQRDVWSRSV